MNLPFKTLPDLFRHFNHEDKCRDFLEKSRWPDGRIICPSCGLRGAYRMADMRSYKCGGKECKSRFTVTVGTMMENSKIPLSKWFAATWLITAHKKGISACQLARDLGIGRKAAWFLNHRIRAMVAERQPEMLKDIVSVDETFVGGKIGNMKKDKRKQYKETGKDNKTPVMGLMERDGKVRLEVIGFNDLKYMVRKNVDKGAILVTDEHLGYRGLDKEYNGHVTVNHSHFVYMQDGFSTNNLEGFFSQLKRMVIGIYHHVSPQHLQQYCNEAAYRYNTRKIKDCDRFVDAIGKAEGRLRYKDLVKPKTPTYNGNDLIEPKKG